MVPLGEGFSVRDLIARLRCEVVVAARNRLGTINHSILTVEALQAVGCKRVTVVMMQVGNVDLSAKTNAKILAEMVAPVPLFTIPDLGRNPGRIGAVKKSEKKIKKTLARILG
jgi:dethiobiotin synthetase